MKVSFPCEIMMIVSFTNPNVLDRNEDNKYITFG